MSKQIKLNYDNKEYILEYNRKSVSAMEVLGFNAKEVDDKMATMIPLMFQGAFIMHHPSIKIALINEIYDKVEDKMKLMNTLSNMINDCYQSLLADNDKKEDDGKNVSWEIM